MNIFRRLYNLYHIRKHGYPSRPAIYEAYVWRAGTPMIIYGRVKKIHNYTLWKVAAEYSVFSNSIEEIADGLNVPRERIRQMLFKILRDYKSKKFSLQEDL